MIIMPFDEGFRLALEEDNIISDICASDSIIK
jgi:hypothetical protein